MVLQKLHYEREDIDRILLLLSFSENSHPFLPLADNVPFLEREGLVRDGRLVST